MGRRFDYVGILAATALISLTVSGLTGCGGGGNGGGTGTPTPTPTVNPDTFKVAILANLGNSTKSTAFLTGATVNTPTRFFGQNITIRIEGHPDLTSVMTRQNNVSTSALWSVTVPNPNNAALYDRDLPFKAYDPDGNEIPFQVNNPTTFRWNTPL